MKKFLIFTVSLLFVLPFAKAQLKEFSKDVNKFVPEMTSLYTAIENKDQRKTGEEFMLTKFTPFWNGGTLSEKMKLDVIDNCNKMLKRKMKVNPHFTAYMKSLMNLGESGKMMSTFDSWHATLSLLMEKSTSNPFLDFLETSDSLFLKNYLYSSNTTIWQSSNNNYEFKFDKEPLVIFPSLVLTCYANKDSSVILDCKGTLYPLQKTFVGEKGRVTWERAELKPEDVYAVFNKFSVNLKSREYSIDSVNFYNKDFFGGTPLLGRMEEKVLANKRGENASYPQFQSYDKRLEIKQIYKNVDFSGGFTMKGARLLGSGDETTDATLTFFREGKPFIICYSKSFAIRKDRVNSERSAFKMIVDQDSIYHPGLTMKYLDTKFDEKKNQNVPVHELSFTRERDDLSQTPFFDTYHKLDMDFEALYWVTDEPKMEFRMIKGPGSSGEANFESANYYSEARFQKLQGIDDVHPFVYLKNYIKQTGNKTFYVKDYAAFRGIQVEVIRLSLISLAVGGFLNYDANNDRVYVKDKVFDYLNCKAAKSDYDVIVFNSIINVESNATLSLLNWDLKMRGISRVFLSDSQKVSIYPTEQEIIVKKNRDFTFAGRVHAGLFDYYGKNFSFEYDKFKINLPIIDSMSFKVRSRKPDDYGNYPLIKVKSVIEDLSGDILIDHPNNKSGRKPFSEYPIFNSKKNSFVYYDKNSSYPGIYKRGEFFYRIDPFTLDSLDDFSTEGLEFKGYLSSADIFPDIDQPLKVMPDYSLGFIRNTGPAGYPAYKGKGTFVNKIDLSNQGLRGNGTLKYLTSESKSDNFLFFPDSTIATVQDFLVNEQKSGTQYPPVSSKNVKEEWSPYKDVMKVRSTDTPFRMYSEDSELSGMLNLTPSALTGDGKMEFKNAIMTSRKYVFKNRVFDTDTCDFSLKTFDLEELAFETKNYKGHVDFDKRKGEFKSNGGTSLVNFPVNEYICYMDQFDWYMDKDEIDLKNNSKEIAGLDKMGIKQLVDVDLAGSEFISVHPAQDSLRFRSSRAKYSLKEQIIHAYDVKIIKVADAAIFPGDGEVTILKKAEMVPLKNAQILANTTTKYHTFTESNVNIYGRKSYSASGYYDFVDELEGVQKIFFDKVAVDSTLQTYAKGRISDSAGFTLSPYFDYYGNVSLRASNEFLRFTGGARIAHKCDTLGRPWIKFDSEINPAEIYIPISDAPTNTNGDRIFAGIYFSNDSVGVYPAFLSKKVKGGDIELASSSGYLTYDKKSNEYRISSREKLLEPLLPGRYLSLGVFQCLAKDEGRLSFGANLGRVAMNNFGRIDHYSVTDSTMIYSVTELDFFFASECLKKMEESFANAGDLSAFDVRSELYNKYLGEVLDKEEQSKAESELILYGYFKKMPEKLEHTITFSDLTLKYNKATRTYLSVGKIGISSIGKTQVNKYVNGKIEMVLKRGSEKLTIYLEVSSGEWYFFTYSNGLMQAISSNKEWNDIIINTKADDRQLSAKGGEKSYNYYISTTSRKDKWLKKMNQNSGEEPEEE